MKIVGTNTEEINRETPGLLILSHGSLSIGLLNSMELICGDFDNIVAFQLEEGDNPDEYQRAFVDYYEKMPDRSIFLIDLFGGTPFNKVMEYFLKNGREIRAVTGVNLGMLMEANFSRLNKEDFLNTISQAGKEAIINIGEQWSNR